MSFMKARQVVQTCVLSKRWRHLWRPVPCLDVDHDEFKRTARVSEDGSDSNDDQCSRLLWRRPWRCGGVSFNSRNVLKTVIASDGNSDSYRDDNSDSDDDTHDSDGDLDGDNSGSNHDRSDANVDDDNHKDKDWEDFEDFTANLMLRCNIAQLVSFRLHIVGSRAPEFGNRQAAGWLRRAMKYCAPDCASKHVGLRSRSRCLKRLHLCHVLLDNRFMKHVRSVCRSLEDLRLDDCTCEIQSITSHSLKTLVLKNCRWCNLSKITSPTLKTIVIDGLSSTNDRVLVIFAPSVAYLHLAVHVKHFSGGISISKVPSLAKASVYLQGHRYNSYSSKLCGDQFKLLCSISNVTSLELSGVGATVLGKEPTLLEFKNLRSLLLDNCDISDSFHTLALFLQICPILEKLTLRHCELPKCCLVKKGTPILYKISSSVLRGLDLLCENLKVEIIYKHGYGPHLLHLLLRVSVNLSKKNIKLTKVN